VRAARSPGTAQAAIVATPSVSGDDSERERISRAHAVDLILENPAEEQARDGPSHDAERSGEQAFANHQSQNRARVGTDSQTYSELGPPLHDHIRQRRVEAEHGKAEREN
jgi:hypothetical protein